MEVPPVGAVYWVTGLPGSGKSTLARALASRLRRSGRTVVRLDGDSIRPIIGVRLGYGQADRRVMAMVYARLCREFAAQGHDVVCATVSMFEEARGWARSEVPDYREIYLQASVETLVARHPKGLLAAGHAGRIRNVPGIDLAVEVPGAPDVLVEDDGTQSAQEIAAEVIARLWPQAPT